MTIIISFAGISPRSVGLGTRVLFRQTTELSVVNSFVETSSYLGTKQISVFYTDMYVYLFDLFTNCIPGFVG